jgi:hypothetical protein
MKLARYGAVFLALSSLLFAGKPTFASEPENIYFEIGAGLARFDYREFDTQDDELLKETGLLPGVSFELGKNAPGFSPVFLFHFAANTVDYDGRTQGGSPLSTDTRERISDFTLLLRAKTEPVSGVVPGISLGMGYREWRRDIQPTPITARLFETYRWKYLQAGLFLHWRSNARWRLAVDASVLRPLDPSIEAYVAGYDAITLDLNAEDSYRVSLPIHYRVSEKTTWVFEPYWQSWNLGRSEPGRLRINGVPTSSLVTEPDSETNVWGVTLRARFD